MVKSARVKFEWEIVKIKISAIKTIILKPRRDCFLSYGQNKPKPFIFFPFYKKR